VHRVMPPTLSLVWPNPDELLTGTSVDFKFAVTGFVLGEGKYLCIFAPSGNDGGFCAANTQFTVPLNPGTHHLRAELRDGETAIEGVPSVGLTFRLLGGNTAKCGNDDKVCIRGECTGEGTCKCRPGAFGRYCQSFNEEPGGVTLLGEDLGPRGLGEAYLELVRAGLLSSLRHQPAADTALRMGTMYPQQRLTMLGQSELVALQAMAMEVLDEDVAGDFMETGVWAGGASILLNAVLRVYDQQTLRKVWVADSFDGVPPPDPDTFPVDQGDTLHLQQGLKVALDQVVLNFRVMNLLTSNVEFLQGWFNDTMLSPRLRNVQLSILRLDGDLYQSTWEVLQAMYPRLSVGGYTIIDDWGLQRSQAKLAVIEFRKRCDITDPLLTVGPNVSWKKSKRSACG